MTTLYPRTSDHACFNMAPPDRNGLRASFILRATDTDVFVFLKKRKAADSPSFFWLSNSTRPVAVQDDGQYGTWLYAQSYADLIFVTFSTLQANSTVCAVLEYSTSCHRVALISPWSSTYQPRIVHSVVTMPSVRRPSSHTAGPQKVPPSSRMPPNLRPDGNWGTITLTPQICLGRRGKSERLPG